MHGFKCNDELLEGIIVSEFLIAVVGSVIGAGSAIVLTYFYDNFRKKARLKEVLEVNKNALLQEVRRNQCLLEESRPTNEPAKSLILHDTIFHSLMGSGNYSNLPADI